MNPCVFTGATAPAFAKKGGSVLGKLAKSERHCSESFCPKRCQSLLILEASAFGRYVDNQISCLVGVGQVGGCISWTDAAKPMTVYDLI